MGVVNVTPDSFSDGGLYLDPEAAIGTWRGACKGWGGDFGCGGGIDSAWGGGSERRGGAGAGSAGDRGAGRGGAVVSVDTSKLAVAEAALDAGAEIVNDVTALRGDPEIAGCARSAGRGWC